MIIGMKVSFAALAFLAVLAKAKADDPSCENMSLELGIKDWVVEAGGAFHDQLEFQRKVIHKGGTSDENDALFHVGIFAKERIQKGEMLMKIPSQCILSSNDNSLDKNGYFSCSGIKAMLKEMEAGDTSFFAPYMSYLKHSRRRDMVPSAWSSPGRELFMHVLGWKGSFKEVMIPPMDPINLDFHYRQQCRKNKKTVNEAELDMAFEYYSRAQGGDLVPLLDMIGHGSGDASNVNVQLQKDNDNNEVVAREVYAIREIPAGQEIRFSFYESEHIRKDENYGTPELFRDRGIVEGFPQRWVFRIDKFTVAFKLNKKDRGDISFEWLPMTKNEFHHDTKAYFRRQLKRMVEFLEPKLDKTEEELSNKKVETGNSDALQPFELASLRQFADALRVALEQAKMAINVRELNYKMDVPFREIKVPKTKRNPNYHDSFPTYNEQDYGALRAEGWETVAQVKSAYQRVEIKANHENVCFVLDNEPQTCSYFSAHYHDIASHFPTRYLESVKRVAILGGGDSKILQDMLQYNSTIEKVIHLELDQVGTRLCFKHFLTDPHFDDNRIEWYFGDAAKSLRMLPSDYFGTFDLVFVDMSESGPLSFGVTKDLTVWDSIAQLLNPNGILVKNELYHEIMSEKFDNTLLLYYEKVPIIESWALTIGTNRKDLLTPDLATIRKWQDVKTHLSYVKAAASDIDDHFRMAHDYKHNDARVDGKCEAAPAASSGDSPLAGILMILEAEELDVDGDVLTDWGKFESKLSPTLVEDHGLSILSSAFVSDDDGINGVIITNEGVITARTSMKERYCAFDIQLWSSFDKLNSLRDGLSTALESNVTSSYRLISTGMRGTDNEAEDQKKTGPPGINNRDCSTYGTNSDKRVAPITTEMLHTVITKSLQMIQARPNGTVAVFCGSDGQECQSLDIANENFPSKVVAIRACASLESIDASQRLSPSQSIDMLSCHDSILIQLLDAVGKNGKITAFVIDSSATMIMIMILDRILMSLANQESLLSMQFTIVAPMNNPSTDKWKHDFMEMLRQELVDYGHLFRARVLLQSDNHKDAEIALLSGQDPHFFPRLVNVTIAIQESTGILTTIEQIEGGVEELDLEQSDLEWLNESAYLRPAEAHFKSQRPLSEQTLVQYERDPEKMKQEFTVESVDAIFQKGFESWKERGLALELQKQVVGKGLVIAAMNVDATAVLIWDGEDRLDMNVLAYEDDWMDRILNPFESLKTLKRLSFDYLPRGVGKVINFEGELDLYNDDNNETEEPNITRETN